MLGDALSPLLLIAAGAVLWISAAAVSAGAAIQTNGATLLVAGLVWLVAEIRHARQAELAEQAELVLVTRR